MSNEPCDAAGCGRRHDVQSLGGAFESLTLCAFHRHVVEAGEGIVLRDGSTGYYDDHAGSYTVPAKWIPRGEVRP